MKKITKIIISAILVIIWMIVIFYFSAMPADESKEKSMNIVKMVVKTFEAKSGLEVDETGSQVKNEIKLESPIKKVQQAEIKERTMLLKKLDRIFRKFAHASVYFILYILVLNLIYQIKGEYRFSYCIISIIVCFIYACTDEFHQLFVEGRAGLFSDVMIDTIGATLSYIVIDIVYKIKKIRKEKL